MSTESFAAVRTRLVLWNVELVMSAACVGAVATWFSLNAYLNGWVAVAFGALSILLSGTMIALYSFYMAGKEKRLLNPGVFIFELTGSAIVVLGLFGTSVKSLIDLGDQNELYSAMNMGARLNLKYYTGPAFGILGSLVFVAIITLVAMAHASYYLGNRERGSELKTDLEMGVSGADPGWQTHSLEAHPTAPRDDSPDKYPF